jgi:hypothetical protein
VIAELYREFHATVAATSVLPPPRRQPPATTAEIAAAEAALGIALPADLAEMYQCVNGGGVLFSGGAVPRCAPHGADSIVEVTAQHRGFYSSSGELPTDVPERCGLLGPDDPYLVLSGIGESCVLYDLTDAGYGRIVGWCVSNDPFTTVAAPSLQHLFGYYVDLAHAGGVHISRRATGATLFGPQPTHAVVDGDLTTIERSHWDALEAELRLKHNLGNPYLNWITCL